MKTILAILGTLAALTTGSAASAVYGVRLGGNLMPNGDFEGTGGWRTFGHCARIEKGVGFGGTAGLVVEKPKGAMKECPHSERFRIEPGLAYRVELRARSLGGEGIRLLPCFTGVDGAGNGVGNTGCRLEIATDNDPRDDGWLRAEGETKAMPANVRSGELFFWAEDAVEGRVCVDDVVIYPVTANTLTSPLSSAYQNRASKGSVVFRAAHAANAERFPEKTLRAEVEYAAADGTRRAAAAVRDGVVAAKLPVESLAFGKSAVRLRLFAGNGAELGSGECAFTRDRTDPPRRVRFDSHGRTILDGKPFLPLGLYFYRVAERDLLRLKEGPFNCIMPYRPEDETIDLCQRHGIMMIGSLSGWFRELDGATPERAGEINRHLRSKVERFRGHPALLAWYLADEVAPEYEPLLRARNEMVHELDPSHPTWIVLDKPSHVHPLAQGYDVIGVDPYPVGNHGGPGRTSIGIAASWAQTARRTTFGFRPMWNVPQLFNWALYRREEAKENPSIRWPTLEEMRSMVWQSVAAGANGLIGYSFFDINGGKCEPRVADEKWGEVCRVFREVKAHESEILSPPGPRASRQPEGAVVRTWRIGGGRLLALVCNTRREPVCGEVAVGDATFRAELAPIGVMWRTLLEE